jgi:hypothetical protein
VADSVPSWKPVVGQPAPELSFSKWLNVDAEKKGAASTTTVSSEHSQPVSRKSKALSDLRDHVVIVHTFAWNDVAAKEKALPLLRDLLAANSDRRIAAIGIADDLELEAARAAAKSMGLEQPIAVDKLADSKSPYVDLATHAACFAFVVGRGGGLLWAGNPALDEKGFLAAVKDALARHAVVPVERRLHEKLGKALAEYYAGHLSRALTLAQDERKAAEKSGEKQVSEDARLLESTAKDAQLAWLREIGEATLKKDATRYVELVQVCKAGLARGDVAADLDRLEKEVHKDNFFEARLLDAQKYLELLDDRPILFPVRRDAAGDRFAGKLEGFARSTPNSTYETRTAKDLADRYRLTAR